MSSDDHEGVTGARPNAEAVRRIGELRDGDVERQSVNGVTRYFSVVAMARRISDFIVALVKVCRLSMPRLKNPHVVGGTSPADRTASAAMYQAKKVLAVMRYASHPGR